jgi:hypothetical protein
MTIDLIHDVVYWPFASFACAQQPSRFQAKADIEGQASPAGSEASEVLGLHIRLSKKQLRFALAPL